MNEEVGQDHLGNIRGAIKEAQKLANELNEDVFINDFTTENIVEVVYPD